MPLRTHVTYRRILNIAYPIILGSIAQNFINVIDTAFLGRLGEIELGAAAIGGVFYLTVIMFGYGLGLGTQIIVARRAGEERNNRIGIVVEHSLATLIASSVIIIALIRFFSPSFFTLIISSPAILEATCDYMHYRSWGILFAFVNMGFNAFYIGIAKTRVITWSTIFMAAVNIILDWLLIFGNLGFPGLGIKGAAIASVCAEFSATLFFIFYTAVFTNTKRYRLFRFSGLNSALWLRLVRLSFPVMLQNVISLAVWFAFFVFVEKMGETELAVSNIIRSIYIILMIPIWGFAAASNTLVSFLIGRGLQEEVVPVVYKTSWLCFIMVLILVAGGLLFPGEIIGVYTDDPRLVASSMPVMYVVNVSVISFAFAMVFLNAVSGTGKTQIALLIEVFVISIYLIAAYAFSNVFMFSVAVVWTVEFLYASLVFLFSFIYLRSNRWMKDITHI